MKFFLILLLLASAYCTVDQFLWSADAQMFRFQSYKSVFPAVGKTIKIEVNVYAPQIGYIYIYLSNVASTLRYSAYTSANYTVYIMTSESSDSTYEYCYFYT